MKKWIVILLTLFTSISITGLSFIDNLILNRIIAILVAFAFFFVGILYKFGFIIGKEEGQEAFKGVLIVLLIFAFVIYLGIRKFQNWVLLWPLALKIIVPSVLGLVFICVIIGAIYDYINNSDQYDN